MAKVEMLNVSISDRTDLWLVLRNRPYYDYPQQHTSLRIGVCLGYRETIVQPYRVFPNALHIEDYARPERSIKRVPGYVQPSQKASPVAVPAQLASCSPCLAPTRSQGLPARTSSVVFLRIFDTCVLSAKEPFKRDPSSFDRRAKTFTCRGQNTTFSKLVEWFVKSVPGPCMCDT